MTEDVRGVGSTGALAPQETPHTAPAQQEIAAKAPHERAKAEGLLGGLSSMRAAPAESSSTSASKLKKPLQVSTAKSETTAETNSSAPPRQPDNAPTPSTAADPMQEMARMMQMQNLHQSMPGGEGAPFDMSHMMGSYPGVNKQEMIANMKREQQENFTKIIKDIAEKGAENIRNAARGQ